MSPPNPSVPDSPTTIPTTTTTTTTIITLTYTHPDMTKFFHPQDADTHLPPSPTFTPSTQDKTKHLSILQRQILELQGQVNEFLTERMKGETPVTQGKRKDKRKAEEEEEEDEEEEDDDDESEGDEEQNKVEGYQQLGAGIGKVVGGAVQ